MGNPYRQKPLNTHLAEIHLGNAYQAIEYLETTIEETKSQIEIGKLGVETLEYWRHKREFNVEIQKFLQNSR